MKNQPWKGLGTALLLVAVPAMAVIVSQSQQAAASDEETDGRIVAISPDEGGELPPAEQADEAPAVEAPKYWIGLQGRPIESAALRTHLQLADDVGVLVENVVPDSPAEKAGLRQHDVIIAVNGEPISDLSALQKVVADGAKKAVDLKVIRLAKETSVEVTPEERPADLAQALPMEGRFGQALGGQMPEIDALLRQFQQNGVKGGGRVFGPDAFLGGQAFNLNQMPDGVSISVARQGEGPAEITIKKADETWTLKSDDEAAINNLPEDVRPFVQQLIEGSRPGQPGLGGAGAMRFNFGDQFQILPHQLGNFNAEGGDDQQALRKRAVAARQRTEDASERLLERMEQMEERIRDLQQQLEENSPAPRTNGDDDPSKT